MYEDIVIPDLVEVNPKCNEEQRAFFHWAYNPVTIIEDQLGINKANGLHLTNQQREFFTILGKLCFCKQKIHDHRKNGNEATIPPNVLQMGSKFGISIRSGKGTGKDFSVAMAIQWFLQNYKLARIPCLGPNAAQLRTVLWPELVKWHTMRNAQDEYIYRDPFRSFIEIDNEKCFYTNTENPGKDWRAFHRSVQRSADPSTMMNALGGQHADNMMVIFDEATGIPLPIFESLENTLTSHMNFALLIWNPNTTSGFAYDTHFRSEVAHQWIQLHWNAEESDRVTPEQIQRMSDKYGKDSDNYRVYVLGEPPRGEDDSLIPFMWVQSAIDRDVGPVDSYPTYLGCDIARGGKDATIIAVRQGPKIHLLEKVYKIDSLDIATEILKIAKEYEAHSIMVDSIGVGAGVFDQLRRYFHNTYGVEVSRVPSDPDKFRRLRDELWWRSRERFEQGLISIPNIPDLVDQLSSVRYTDHLMQGKIVVEGKDDMRKRLGGSPDYADALNLTFFIDEAYGRIRPINQKRDVWDDAFSAQSRSKERRGWMVG